MNREALIEYMVAEALAEDEREGSRFDKDGFSNFFPEYREDAAEHDVEWDDNIWDEAFAAYAAAAVWRE
jgi:hypothetical protein